MMTEEIKDKKVAYLKPSSALERIEDLQRSNISLFTSICSAELAANLVIWILTL